MRKLLKLRHDKSTAVFDYDTLLLSLHPSVHVFLARQCGRADFELNVPAIQATLRRVLSNVELMNGRVPADLNDRLVLSNEAAHELCRRAVIVCADVAAMHYGEVEDKLLEGIYAAA